MNPFALRATPHYIERLAAGALPGFYIRWLSSAEQAAVKNRRTAIIALRRRGDPVAHPLYLLHHLGHITVWRHISTGFSNSARRVDYVVMRDDETLAHRCPRHAAVSTARTFLRLMESPRSLRDALAAPVMDPQAPDTLGWRAWRWLYGPGLTSPMQGTPWRDGELRVEHWDDSSALRGVAGIHALRVPLDWRRSAWPPDAICPSPPRERMVTGIVERYGRYVLGR